MISQPGGKPGQTTILLAQPSSQQAASVVSSQVLASTTPGVKVAPGVVSKGKTAPIYARIITPPQSVRLAAIRPGQVVAGSQVAPLQGLVQTGAAATQGLVGEKSGTTVSTETLAETESAS